MTGPHSWRDPSHSPVYAVMDGSQIVALFSSAELAQQWVTQQRAASDPGRQLAAKAYTVEEKRVWHVLPT